MNTTSKMRDVLKNAKCLYNLEQIEKAIDGMANAINKHPLSESSPILLGVAVGGFLPLSSLALRLKFPLQIDFSHISSYGDEFQSGKLQWKVKPHLSLKDRTVVVVDDILDQGLTLAEMVDFCKKEGAKEIFTAVLVDKKTNRDLKGVQSADFVGVEIEDRFVFGYGLDFKGFLRNAPGIYEVAEEDK